MAQTATLNAEPRTTGRKPAVKAVRKAGQVPAVIYGRGRDAATLAVNEAELTRLLEKIEPESTIVELAVRGQGAVKTLIREIQRHPLKDTVLHVDFLEIHADEAIRLEIPVHLTGTPEGVRNQGGTLDQVLRTVEIEVLPADIPERVELDTTALTIGKSLHVSDLRIPKAKLITDAALTVCTVVAPRVEEAPVAAAAEGAVAEAAVGEAVAEPEVIKKGKTEEEAAEE
jgi:large subunit ribosomal protein L25